jgi:hypothetical protein
MRRHERRCLDPKLIEAAAKTENAEAKRLVNRVDRIVTRLEKRCEESDSWQQTDSWLKIIRELRPYHELYGRASQELANDKVQGLLIELGVRTADEAKNLVALSRVGAQLSLAEVKAEWEQATRFLLAEGAVNVQDVQRIVGQASYAVELTNGNGEPH